MFCFCVGDILVVTSNECVTPVDNVVEELICFVCCKEFLFSDGVFQLGVIEFSGKGTDNLFSAVAFLC